MRREEQKAEVCGKRQCVYCLERKVCGTALSRLHSALLQRSCFCNVSTILDSKVLLIGGEQSQDTLDGQKALGKRKIWASLLKPLPPQLGREVI